jgi:hypothetical protein
MPQINRPTLSFFHLNYQLTSITSWMFFCIFKKQILKIFLIPALLVLASLCGCSQSRVQQEIDKFKNEGKPVTLEELHLPKGGYKHKDWGTFILVSEELKNDGDLKNLEKLRLDSMKHVASGIAQSITLQPFVKEISDKKTHAWKTVAKKLLNVRKALSKLSLLNRDSDVVYIPDYYQGPNIEIPHASMALHLIKTQRLLIMTDLALKNTDQALDGLESSRLIKSRLLTANSLIEGLVNVTCDSILVTCSWDMLQHRNMTEAQLFRLQTIWGSTFQPEDILRLWRGERITITDYLVRLKSLKDLKNLIQSVGDTTADIPESSLLSQMVWNCMPIRQLVDLNLSSYLSIFHGIENGMLEWKQTGNFLPLKRQVDEQMIILKNPRLLNSISSLFSRLAIPSIDKALDKFAVSMAEQRMLQTAIALQRYYLANNQYPSSLSLLVPTYLTELPLDAIDGQPLRYLSEPDGGYQLYSIGLNGSDDGGNGEEITPQKTPTWRSDKTYDIVWPSLEK